MGVSTPGFGTQSKQSTTKHDTGPQGAAGTLRCANIAAGRSIIACVTAYALENEGGYCKKALS